MTEAEAVVEKEKKATVEKEEKQEIIVEQEPEKQEVSKEQEEPKKEASSEDELESYSKSVQSRIKKLTEKYRQEERDKEEAVTLSRRLIEENKKLQTRVKNLDTGYVSEYGTRLQAQSQQAKQMYTEAYEAGDANKMAEAQQAMAAIAVEQQNYNTAKLRVEQQAKAQPRVPQQQAPQQQAPQQHKPDARAEKWASDNNWFGQDKIMTTAAFTLHNILTNEEGFDASSEEYYNEIDKRIRKEFPQKFSTQKKTGGTQVASAGNSASRNKQGRRTVKLSPSQVAIAKKLGVPLEEYAKHVKE
tara:strand:+ start:626 stop:1528 length:903 start_codon:yes stop_codon:yes gene_type:complete